MCHPRLLTDFSSTRIVTHEARGGLGLSRDVHGTIGKMTDHRRSDVEQITVHSDEQAFLVALTPTAADGATPPAEIADTTHSGPACQGELSPLVHSKSA